MLRWCTSFYLSSYPDKYNDVNFLAAILKMESKCYVLYKKICLRCTKLYFSWQTIIRIALKELNWFLQYISKHT